MFWVLLFFICVPILEMLLLIEVGGVLGTLPTIGLVMLTAVIGVSMLKQQGLSTLARFQQKSSQGELPGDELFSAVFLLIAGALLLTPGFFTDLLGFALLIPQFRSRLARVLLAKGLMQVGSQFQMHQNPSSSFTEDPLERKRAQDETEKQPGNVIEGEFSRKD